MGICLILYLGIADIWSIIGLFGCIDRDFGLLLMRFIADLNVECLWSEAWDLFAFDWILWRG